jgi:hypothetical protein
MLRTWDSVAQRLRFALGIMEGETEDARVIAALCGVRLAPARMVGAALYRGAIYYDAAAPKAERRLLIATELGRWALLRAELPTIEEGARHVGLVLMIGTERRRESGVLPIFG